MEDTMKVLELLEELEDIVDNATNVPLTSKIMLEAEDVFNIVRATKLAQEIREDAELHAKMLKMRTYDYVDKMLYDMQAKMDELNLKYFGEMYTNLDKTFSIINQTLSDNRDEIKQLAYQTQNDLDTEA